MSGRRSLVFVLAATANAYAQGDPPAPPPEPASEPASEPAPAEPAPAEPAAPALPAQGLPALPGAPHVYTPPPPPAADPGRATVDSGASLTGSGGGWLHAAWMFEGGYTIPKLVPAPYFIRVRAALRLVGGTKQSDWSGAFTRYAAGAEAGRCGSLICGFVDLDIAYQHATLDDDSAVQVGDRKGPLLYGRAGIDIGPRRIHLRAALEVGEWKTHHSPSTWRTTGGLFVAVGIRL